MCIKIILRVWKEDSAQPLRKARKDWFYLLDFKVWKVVKIIIFQKIKLQLTWLQHLEGIKLQILEQFKVWVKILIKTMKKPKIIISFLSLYILTQNTPSKNLKSKIKKYLKMKKLKITLRCKILRLVLR